MTRIIQRASFGPLCMLLLAGGGSQAMAQETNRGGAFDGGRIFNQYTGRVALDFTRGTGVVYGYFVTFGDLPTASLFRGAPSESTAVLTFRSDITFQPLAGNGELGPNSVAVFPTLVVPGTFKIYHTANPSRTWSDSNSFSNGTLVATFNRSGEMFSLIGPVGLNTASATLESSEPFTVGDVIVNLRRLVPRGVTNITTGNNAPLPGSTQVAPIFAFAGYGLAIGR